MPQKCKVNASVVLKHNHDWPWLPRLPWLDWLIGHLGFVRDCLFALTALTWLIVSALNVGDVLRNFGLVGHCLNAGDALNDLVGDCLIALTDFVDLNFMKLEFHILDWNSHVGLLTCWIFLCLCWLFLWIWDCWRHHRLRRAQGIPDTYMRLEMSPGRRHISLASALDQNRHYQVSDISIALDDHFASNPGGPTNHLTQEDFVHEWIHMETTLAAIPVSELTMRLKTMLPTGAIPPLPATMILDLCQQGLKPSVRFMAPTCMKSSQFMQAWTNRSDKEHLIPICILPPLTFLQKFGTRSLISFMSCMHMEGRPRTLGILLEQLDCPDQGEIMSLSFALH